MAEIIQLPKPPRMRGIKQAIEELRKADPETALTETVLRRLISAGGWHTVGLKKDGTVVAVGSSYGDGISGWSDIKLPPQN